MRLLAPGAPLVIGVNATFYGEGTLVRKLTALGTAGQIERVAEEYGDHIGSAGMTGWTVAVRKV